MISLILSGFLFKQIEMHFLVNNCINFSFWGPGANKTPQEKKKGPQKRRKGTFERES